VEESHSDGLLEYPVYTKPALWRDREVPAVLLSGNHGKIAQWRRHQQYSRTADRRPDLLETFDAGRLPRADRTALQDLGYDVAGDRLVRRGEKDGPAAG
jgi:tRNA (guanine37-N1)-methyltransferase